MLWFLTTWNRTKWSPKKIFTCCVLGELTPKIGPTIVEQIVTIFRCWLGMSHQLGWYLVRNIGCFRSTFPRYLHGQESPGISEWADSEVVPSKGLVALYRMEINKMLTDQVYLQTSVSFGNFCFSSTKPNHCDPIQNVMIPVLTKTCFCPLGGKSQHFVVSLDRWNHTLMWKVLRDPRWTFGTWEL